MFGVDYFITGACGMVGSHIIDKLEANHTTYVSTFFNPQAREPNSQKTNHITCDIRDGAAISSLISTHRPRVIFHLAAQSYPTISWNNPHETMEINANGTINVLEAVLACKRADNNYDPVVVIACSSAEYGASMTTENVPIHEDTPLLPLHPYGVSKVAQDLLGYQYFACFGLRTIRARIFNTTGPRKQNDVISDWAERIVDIECGKEKILRVGNLNAKRAIMDVSDLIKALFLLSEKGHAGEVYNICHDKLIDMGDLLNLFKTKATCPIAHEVDLALLRPKDEAVIYGSNKRLKDHTGWQPLILIEETVNTMLNHARINR
jgi:nucleoside-diphosphate-sugar epimerase